MAVDHAGGVVVVARRVVAADHAGGVGRRVARRVVEAAARRVVAHKAVAADHAGRVVRRVVAQRVVVGKVVAGGAPVVATSG